jgi:siderophore synthetase component
MYAICLVKPSYFETSRKAKRVRTRWTTKIEIPKDLLTDKSHNHATQEKPHCYPATIMEKVHQSHSGNKSHNWNTYTDKKRYSAPMAIKLNLLWCRIYHSL